MDAATHVQRQSVRPRQRADLATSSEAWVDGFVSGVNAAGADGGWSDFLSSKPKTDALYAMVDSYCRRNGIDNVADAAADTVKELKKQAQR